MLMPKTERQELWLPRTAFSQNLFWCDSPRRFRQKAQKDQRLFVGVKQQLQAKQKQLFEILVECFPYIMSIKRYLQYIASTF